MPDPRFQIVAPYSDKYQRNSEGAIAVLPDGQWLLGWTAFYGGFHDPSPAHILGMWSDDKGETWSEPVVLLENDGKCNVMNVCFAQPGDGSVVMSHVRTDDDTCFYSWPFYRKSTDGGHTWSAHKPMVDMDNWFGFPANDRLIELSSGRLLVPLGFHTKTEGGETESFVQAGYSDDKGETWQLSSNAVTVTASEKRGGASFSGAGEPAAFEREDGTVVFFIRTRLGTIWAAETSDGGETMSETYDTGLQCPAAPCIVRRIPSTGDLLLVWNNAHRDKPGSGGPRRPLTTAVSRDDGRTWGDFKDLEPASGRTHMYPALTFDGDTALVLYSEGGSKSVEEWGSNWHNTSLKLALVPYQWFYE